MQLFCCNVFLHGSLLRSDLLCMFVGSIAFYKRFLFELPSLSLKPLYRVQRSELKPSMQLFVRNEWKRTQDSLLLHWQCAESA